MPIEQFNNSFESLILGELQKISNRIERLSTYSNSPALAGLSAGVVGTVGDIHGSHVPARGSVSGTVSTNGRLRL